MSSAFIPPTPQVKPANQGGTPGSPAASPVLEFKLPDSASTIDPNLDFEVNRLAFESVAKIGELLTERISQLKPVLASQSVRIVYLDRTLRGGLDLLGATVSQLDNLTRSFEEAGEFAAEALKEFDKPGADDIVDAQGLPLGPVAPFSLPGVQSAVNLLGLLSTESHFFGRKVLIAEEPFLLEISNQLRKLKANVTLFHPALFTPWTKRDSFRLPAELQTRIDATINARQKAARPVKRLLATSAQLKIEDPRYLEMRFAADQARDQFESTDALFKELNARLSSKDEVLGLSGFQLVLRAAAVVEILNVDPCHTLLLLARMEMAGGSYRIVKSLSRLVFGGDGVDYSAGVIASFGVFQLDGSLIDSGILTTQASFRPIAKAGFWHDRFVPLLVILLLSTLVYRLIR